MQKGKFCTCLSGMLATHSEMSRNGQLIVAPKGDHLFSSAPQMGQESFWTPKQLQGIECQIHPMQAGQRLVANEMNLLGALMGVCVCVGGCGFFPPPGYPSKEI